MAGIKIGASHLKYLQLSKSKWTLSDLQRSLNQFRRCLTTVLPRYSFPEDSCTAHAPLSWQLLGGSRERWYSTASVALKETVSLSPAVKYLVDTNNISDLSLIKPSGPKDRILKGDVLQYLDDIKSGRIPTPPTTSSTQGAAATAAPVMPTQQISPPTLSSTQSPSVPVVKMNSKSSPVSSSVSYIDIPVDEVQRSRARQMVQSKATMPHVYATTSCSIQRLVKLAKSLEDDINSGGFEAFLIKAAALTLQRLPECNAVWTTSEAPQPLSSVDVSVILYSNSGPITALLKDVNSLGILDLCQTIKELLDGTRVPPAPELQTGYFSIIYLGDSGVSDFTAVLNPGQAAVLSIGSIKLTPSDTSVNQSKSTQAITVTLTADARVYRDELVCRWLDEFKSTVESPEAYGLL